MYMILSLANNDGFVLCGPDPFPFLSPLTVLAAVTSPDISWSVEGTWPCLALTALSTSNIFPLNGTFFHNRFIFLLGALYQVMEVPYYSKSAKTFAINS